MKIYISKIFRSKSGGVWKNKRIISLRNISDYFSQTKAIFVDCCLSIQADFSETAKGLSTVYIES